MSQRSIHFSISDICQRFRDCGQRPYGSAPITQLEHALQCAALAEAADQPNEMIAACLLHDLGHLLHTLGNRAADQGIDDRHEYRVIPYLKPLFGPAVLEPIRFHVQAKRYLCAVDPTYWNSLSSGSKETLALQGGIFSDAEASAFISQPYAREAVQLRRWDDQAKIVGLSTPDLEHFVKTLSACRL